MDPITTAAGVQTNEVNYATQAQLISKKEDLRESIVQQTEIIKTAEQIIAQNESLLSLNEANNPLNKLYGGIKEFQLTKSMCMSMGTNGMGMGQMGDSSMQLTGRELLDIASLILENDDGSGNAKYKPSELAEQMKSKGYNVEGDDSTTSLKYTREDGSVIEFKDANGDGQLNGMDYDFSCALEQFNADLAAYTNTKETLENEIAVQESTVTEAEQTNRKSSDDISVIDKSLTVSSTPHKQDWDPNTDNLYASGSKGQGRVTSEYSALMSEMDNLISNGKIDNATAQKAMTKIQAALDHAYVELELNMNDTIDDTPQNIKKTVKSSQVEKYVHMRNKGKEYGFEYKTGNSDVDSGKYDTVKESSNTEAENGTNLNTAAAASSNQTSADTEENDTNEEAAAVNTTEADAVEVDTTVNVDVNTGTDTSSNAGSNANDITQDIENKPLK